MGINYIPGEPRPWFIRPPINIEDSIKKNEKNKIDPLLKIDPDWKLPADYSLQVLPQEEMKSSNRLSQELKSINAEDWASDLSEEQQWTLVETMGSIKNSMMAMQHSIWSIEPKVCAAVYGNNLAKIEFACRILGSECKGKLKEALDWYAERTFLEKKNMFQIYPESADYKNLVQVFQQVGNFTDAGSGKDSLELKLYADINNDALYFKKNLQESLQQLHLSLGKKNIWTNSGNGWEAILYEPLITDDWDKYFSKLMSHNAGPDNLSAYILKYDVTA
jgi:hypothetical protein